ncbi:RTA1 domain protein [Cordyceps militaris CM01]|uniref:RTA1 domain protein n=1 Tax=Cordyceps militaris (strain CM01) TaxID=983644 RepID=G3J8L3_CORMM|nr:RTA1 domain protein [Cordyceps militaris CM01]EGX94800.1 RTA1 domain protein [Cordyceps militaris CM01]
MLLRPTPTLHLRATSPSPPCTTAVPDKFGHVPPESCNANYGFYPQWQDNLVFAALFGLVTAAHLAQAIRFCWVIIMGASWECICFVLRTLGARDQQNSTYVMLSTLIFLLAPLWINAFVYMVVARLVYFLDAAKRVLRIRATWLAQGFVSADVVCFAVQAVGGALMAGGQNNPKNANLGKTIYMVGCSIQLACVVVFVFVVAAFHRTVLRDRRAGTAKTRNRRIQPLFWERIIFRLVEFSRGADSSNPLLRREWYQLYLDGLPMLLALAALNLVHPALVLQGKDSEMPPSKLQCWRRRQSNFGPLPLHSIESLERLSQRN